MKALTTIGWQKAWRFVWYELYKVVLHWVIFPPLRTMLLRLGGAKIGANCVILDVDFVNLYHHGFQRLQIGDNCFIGDGVMLDLRGGIVLGGSVTISNRANIVSHINVGYPDHPLQRIYPTSEGQVRLARGVYIGTGATILPGVTVGRESVVGAGAVVTHNVLARVVVGGIPAKVIKKI